MVLTYETAKKELLTSSPKGCQSFFYENDCLLEAAYCELLSDNPDKAQSLFMMLKDENPRAKWGTVLAGLIKGMLYEYPTYFGLRNFLEIDLDILIKHYKGDYVENIVRYADFLSQFNPEVYKYIGRVFLNNGLITQGTAFLEIGKSHFYKDPELHYIFAEKYFNDKDYKNALKYTHSCLEILPGYFPACNLLKKIKI